MGETQQLPFVIYYDQLSQKGLQAVLGSSYSRVTLCLNLVLSCFQRRLPVFSFTEVETSGISHSVDVSRSCHRVFVGLSHVLACSFRHKVILKYF